MKREKTSPDSVLRRSTRLATAYLMKPTDMIGFDGGGLNDDSFTSEHTKVHIAWTLCLCCAAVAYVFCAPKGTRTMTAWERVDHRFGATDLRS